MEIEYFKVSQGISRYLRVSQGISRYLKVSQGISRYRKVSQGISRPGTAQKELGRWKLSISRYLKVSQNISRYRKVSQGISRYTSRYLKARKGLKGAGELEIEYLKVSQGSERLKRS